LLAEDGVAAGAAGVRRRTGETWAVRAGAAVVATGGTAFKSVTAGTGGLTGDGYLLAGEAGAVFSGMEFTGQFHIRPFGGTLTKGAYRGEEAQLTDNNGKPVTLGRQTVAAILETGAVWDSFEKVTDPELQELILKASYGTTQFFDDTGINPFTGRHRADFVCEGSIRATGGIAIDDELQSTVPGLFASGDVTSREKVNGAGPPGGGPAAGWALGAGFFSGQSAARFARRQVGAASAGRTLRPAGGAGLRPTRARRADIDLRHVEAGVQDHMFALDRNYWRDGVSLAASLERFGGYWRDLREGLVAAEAGDARSSARNTLRARETAALVAAARWINTSALERKETRGLHRRSDFPALDLAQTHHLITGGVDTVWVRRQDVDPTAVFPGKERFFPEAGVGAVAATSEVKGVA